LGDYPTPGGNRVVNKAFMNFYEGKDAELIKIVIHYLNLFIGYSSEFLLVSFFRLDLTYHKISRLSLW
jgi:hypothetical protein